MSDKSEPNKWSQPDNPPPPLFIGKKERDLVKQVNDELIERVIGQQVNGKVRQQPQNHLLTKDPL